jgi:2-oxo-4-hydroxy-4-carboxy-5-ureidoimidazoline decarboxylase
VTGGLDSLNRLDPAAARSVLLGCCGSRRWAATVERGRPYGSIEDVGDQAAQAFDRLEADDWLEAFAAHARIGEPHDGDRQGAGEQAGAAAADAAERGRLAAGNAAYEARFGHVFLICATGLDAAAMLTALERRYANPPEVELAVAGAEQRRITRLRLDRLLGGPTGEAAGAGGEAAEADACAVAGADAVAGAGEASGAVR